MLNGRIFNVQRYSVHDGPGIRTCVFFMGCNLRCKWCHNSESWTMKSVLEYNPDLCISCGLCAATCANGAHTLNDGVHCYERTACAACGKCANNCFSGALTWVGNELTEEELMKEILTDVPYFKQSSGGVTFSGGECMLQIDFLEAMLRTCHEQGIHTAVDTAGCVPWESFRRILPYTDLFLYDIKALDSGIHKDLTGQGNELILANLDRLLENQAKVFVRIPCVMGANETEIPKIAAWLNGRTVDRVDLLAYHQMGKSKEKMLGLPSYTFEKPSKEQMQEWMALFRANGIEVHSNI